MLYAGHRWWFGFDKRSRAMNATPKGGLLFQILDDRPWMGVKSGLVINQAYIIPNQDANAFTFIWSSLGAASQRSWSFRCWNPNVRVLIFKSGHLYSGTWQINHEAQLKVCIFRNRLIPPGLKLYIFLKFPYPLWKRCRHRLSAAIANTWRKRRYCHA